MADTVAGYAKLAACGFASEACERFKQVDSGFNQPAEQG
jgi:hypothetical protein